MKKIMVILVMSFSVSGCAWFAGGADYTYSHTTPDGTETAVKIHSTREVNSGVKLTIAPDGEVSVETGQLASGTNNMDQALGIIDGLVKTAGKVAIP